MITNILKLIYELNCEIWIKEDSFDTFTVRVGKRGRYSQTSIPLDTVLQSDVDILEYTIRHLVKGIDAYLVAKGE